MYNFTDRRKFLDEQLLGNVNFFQDREAYSFRATFSKRQKSRVGQNVCMVTTVGCENLVNASANC